MATNPLLLSQARLLRCVTARFHWPQYCGGIRPAEAGRCSYRALPGGQPFRGYAAVMGHHDADPAERRRYAGVVFMSVAVLALLFVGAFALHALSQH